MRRRNIRAGGFHSRPRLLIELHRELYGFTYTKIWIIPVLYDPRAQPDIPGGKRIQGFLAAASRFFAHWRNIEVSSVPPEMPH